MHKLQKYAVVMTLTKEQCPWWDKEVVKAGAIATEAPDYYDCCSATGIFVSVEGVECPTEIPKQFLTKLTEGGSVNNNLN